MHSVAGIIPARAWRWDTSRATEMATEAVPGWGMAAAVQAVMVAATEMAAVMAVEMVTVAATVVVTEEAMAEVTE